MKAIERFNIQFIELWYTDILGAVKSVMIPASRIENALQHGVHFDGSSLDGFARVAESDMELMPDPNTFAILPWTSESNRTARLICNVHTTQGDPFIGDPRQALIRVLKQAEEMGFSFMTGMEMEFFLFKDTACQSADDATYFDMPTDQIQHVQRQMIQTLTDMGIGVHSHHSEIGQGQHEFELAYDHALRMADNILTARVALKTVARHHNMIATFMPRPCAGQPGSGLHTHQSLHLIRNGQNIFYDANHEYGLSETARLFMAGQLQHARAMTAILAPLVNSYKRLGKSFEAPVYISWARINRAALIRIPSIQPGMEDHTRLELRCPDPSSNPYLAAAVMLKAGLDGIKNHTPLPDPLEETLLSHRKARMRQVDLLPDTLGEALAALREDDVILSALGPYISDRFIEAKQQEFDDYNQHITRWELDRYLNRY